MMTMWITKETTTTTAMTILVMPTTVTAMVTDGAAAPGGEGVTWPQFLKWLMEFLPGAVAPNKVDWMNAWIGFGTLLLAVVVLAPDFVRWLRDW
ncbi:hypothetical protein B0T25DRAFT_546887 [Lasiosphaeria hispida]|uniref:Uncharacterized protein n=1 Tax=Lasiosphaeria hispida TaxID=260671 RepID=A0AAJ0HDN7_9PEZI|nr:hypothetical protein B0T25DRAFT_546887 [Lasiosphaeria hispida]